MDYEEYWTAENGDTKKIVPDVGDFVRIICKYITYEKKETIYDVTGIFLGLCNIERIRTEKKPRIIMSDQDYTRADFSKKGGSHWCVLENGDEIVFPIYMIHDIWIIARMSNAIKDDN